MRNILSSISKEDFKKDVLSEEKEKERVARIAGVFKDFIEDDILDLIDKQKDFMAREANNVDAFNFARGTINGLYLLLELYEGDYSRHLKYIQEANESNVKIENGQPIGEL